MIHVTLRLCPHNPGAYDLARDEAPASAPEGARVESHLTQWITVHRGDVDRVDAHYVFDEAYATAHPESVEEAHLTMLQAMLTAKLFDDGELVVTAEQLAGSVLWPAIGTPRASLGRRRAVRA